MIYVLILLAFNHHVGITQEFNSKSACEAAAASIVEQLKPKWVEDFVVYSCTPKGEEEV